MIPVIMTGGKVLAVALLLVSTSKAAYAAEGRPDARRIPSSARDAVIPPSAPYANLVRREFGRLRYSKEGALTRPNIRLRFDYAGKKWGFDNWNKIQGETLALEKGNTGTCSQLTLYLRRRLENVVDKKRYKLQIVNAREAMFFSGPRSNHYLLALIERETGKRWFIDPSFKRYDSAKNFLDYKIRYIGVHKTFLRGTSEDVRFFLGRSMPITLERGYLVSIVAGAVDKQFDAENHRISLVIQRPYDFAHRTVYAIRRKAGTLEWLRDEAYAAETIGKERYREFVRILDRLYEESKR
jgi:hypothetical protein